jgi:benzoate membrane transport protein
LRDKPERQLLKTLSTALPVIILALIVLTLPLSIAQDLGLTDGETISWLLALYGASHIVALGFSYSYKIPLLFTGNIFVIIFIASLSGDLSYSELVGASMLAGAAVFLVSLFGLSGRLGQLIPTPVVLGLLIGAVFPFLTDTFSALGEAPWIVGSTVVVFIISRAWLEDRVPAILPAMLAGLMATGLSGQFNPLPQQLEFIMPAITLPSFTLKSVLTAVPVLIVLITLQSNLPSIIFLKAQGFDVPGRRIGLISGAATLLSSLLGPNGISLSLPVTSLIGGESAGAKERRYQAIYWIAGIAATAGLAAGFAAEIPAIIPRPLLLSLAGLAIIDIFVDSIVKIVSGPLLYGPLLAFIISLSDISLFGFGSFFWGMLTGTVVSWIWEQKAPSESRLPGAEGD